MAARSANAGAARQRGQALTEFIVIALVLIPLFLLVPAIAKYQDLSHSAEMASRYLAFEQTTRNVGEGKWSTPEQLAMDVRRRFFSNPLSPIKNNDAAGNFRADQNPYWTDQKGDALIRDFDADVRVSFGADQNPSQAGGYSAASDDLPFVFARKPLGLEAPGVFTANISIALADLPAPEGTYTKTYDTFAKLGLVMRRHTSLLLDPWTADGPDQVADRIKDPILFPGALLEPAAPVVELAVDIVESPACMPGVCSKRGPKLGKLDFWRDVVPADRVK
jgi:hypothetical protein